MQLYTLQVESKDSGLRLDKFLTANSPQVISRTQIKRLLSQEGILVNGKRKKASYKVRTNDVISFGISHDNQNIVQAENIPLDVVYEDDDLLVINKPSGMVTHPAAGNYSGTLVNALRYYSRSLSSVNQPLRPGIIHRLDKDTSGLILVAKNDKAHVYLARQFQDRSIRKKYVALVEGVVQFDEGVIDLPIRRHPRFRKKMSVGFSKSRHAKTIYKTLKRFEDFSLLELSPQTGRTHQLRVHLAYLGHPILGDRKYGKGRICRRLALHASLIGFRHPSTGRYMEFSSELPRELQEIIED
jgi:23S rRNA pseudouridine1911/1915/1917 synthase